MSDLARELRDEYPAVDVTTVVFLRDFAGIGCCVIPQERVLAVISALEGRADLVKALTSARAALALPMEALGYASAENDRAHWPIRDELLHHIDQALAKAGESTRQGNVVRDGVGENRSGT